MEIVTTVGAVRALSRAARASGRSVGFVPTMGFLHAGHYSLMEAARARCDVVVASIFVNPAQFGPGEDLDAYPADLEGDVAGSERAGVDVLWMPERAHLYPPGFATSVAVGGLTNALCGAGRPHHFEGVTTVVCKLFHGVEPDAAFFGEKDYQQLRIVERMVRDLDLPVEIVGCPIVREPDGVAMSSRNSYLSPAQRVAARCLRRGLDAAVAAWEAGERGCVALAAAARAVVEAEPLAISEYVGVRDATDLSAVARAEGSVVVALAAQVGPARLIDNQVLRA